MQKVRLISNSRVPDPSHITRRARKDGNGAFQQNPERSKKQGTHKNGQLALSVTVHGAACSFKIGFEIVPFDEGNGRSRFPLLWRGSGFERFPRWGWHNRDMYVLLKLPLRIKTPELRRVHAVFK